MQAIQYLSEFLQAKLNQGPLGQAHGDHFVSSRVHQLRGWQKGVWLKREDELPGLFAGSKTRKLWGLAAAWQAHQSDLILALGSQRSPFLLSLAQLTCELGIELKTFVKEASPFRDDAFEIWAKLLLAKVEQTVIERSAWSQVSALCDEQAKLWQQSGRRVYRIAEGGAQWDGLIGALTLPLDIVWQEKRLGLKFDRIFVDAGTGLTAQALILGLRALGRDCPVEVLLCAGTESGFQADLNNYQAAFYSELPLFKPTELKLNFRCHHPLQARSYGATNQGVFRQVMESAQNSGILADPLYVAKLLIFAQQFLEKNKSGSDNVLIIHSGGVNNLLGFREQLLKL